MPKLVHITASAKAERVKAELVDNAYRLFRERGYNNVSIKDITSSVGLTTGAFYYHFRNKAEVLRFHAMKNGKWIREELPKILETVENYSERIELFLSKYMCDIFEEEGWEMCEFRMFSVHYEKRESNAFRDTLTNFVEEAIQNGSLSDAYDTGEIVNSLLIVYRGVEYDWCSYHGEYSIHERMQQQIHILLEHYKKK